MYSEERQMNKCVISVVIPVLNEYSQINTIIGHLHAQDFDRDYEIIIVDGDPQGGTLKVVADRNVICLTCERGRGRQMNAGAAIARGDILLFLHADTRLPTRALKKIAYVLENEKYVGGAFDLGIDSDRWFLKYIAVRASLRSRLNRIPYGDQAIFIRKNYFDKIGGFKDIPLMEDVDLMRRLKKDNAQIHIFRDRVLTSARRWETEGALYTTLRNRIVVFLYYLGVSPHTLAKFYKPCSNRWRKKKKIDIVEG
jgi:rSAM/selenodomain-associated transferase 2